MQNGSIQDEGPARRVVSAYLQQSTPAQQLDVEFDVAQGASVAVRRVSLRDETGRPLSAAPERGQSLTLHLSFEVREARPDINVGLSLVDELGVVILDDALRDSRPPEALPRAPGLYLLTMTIPPMLRVGAYVVRCWIGNDFEDFVERELLSFRIAPKPDDPEEFTERLRVVQPEISWTLARDPAPPRS